MSFDADVQHSHLTRLYMFASPPYYISHIFFLVGRLFLRGAENVFGASQVTVIREILKIVKCMF